MRSNGAAAFIHQAHETLFRCSYHQAQWPTSGVSVFTTTSEGEAKAALADCIGITDEDVWRPLPDEAGETV